MPSDSLLNSIDSIFAKKPQIAQINKQAATYSYNYATAKFNGFEQTLTGTTKESDTIIVQGSLRNINWKNSFWM